MNILVTGNLGYIGTVLVQILLKKGYSVKGYDIGYYENCLVSRIKKNFKQIKKDLKDIKIRDLSNIDCIIHLAGLSNDPLGEFDPNITKEINYKATKKLAELAKKKGVKRFIFVSTQSIYGISKTKKPLKENGKKNPITIYAKTKILCEKFLKKIANKSFTVCFLRPSTIFGPSPRLRSDIVLNNLVAAAHIYNKIVIKSDGSPYRPVLHIEDLCSAIIACIKAPSRIIQKQAFNVGIQNGNYSIKEIANKVKKYFPKSKIIFTKEHGKDSRSYVVSFDKILKKLKGFYKPIWNLDTGIVELKSFYKEINLTEKDFTSWKTIRLLKLKKYFKKK